VSKIIVNKFPNAMRGVEKGAKKAALRMALAIETDIKDRMSEPGRGIEYGTHTASAPGDPPAVDTGALRASILSREINDGATVSSHMEYAVYLELGTSKMAPRPVWIPVAREVSGRAVAVCRDGVADGLREEGIS